MKLKKTLLTILMSFSFVLPFNSLAASQKELFETLFSSTVISYGAGSSLVSYILVASVKAKTRQKVELGYLTTSKAYIEPGFSLASDSDRNTIHVEYLMLNCDEHTYSPEDLEGGNTAYKRYHHADIYKWGDYKDIFYVSPDNSEKNEEITKMFEDVCAYASYF